MPAPVMGRSGDEWRRCRGTCPARVRAPPARRLRGVVAIDEVALGQRDDAVAEAEQPQDFEMFARLRHDGIVGGDDEQGEVDAGGSGEHVLDEALVARHVHDAEAVGGRDRGGRSRCRW